MLTTFVQIPNLNIEEEVEARLERKLTNREKESLKFRVSAVNYWLENYASSEDKFELQENKPPLMNSLNTKQKQFLVELGEYLTLKDENRLENTIKDNIYEIARKTPISATDAFQAVYKSLLNKDYGPKVWTFLSAVPISLLEKRFLPIDVNAMDFIEEVGIYDLEKNIDNIKKINNIYDKVYIKNPANKENEYNEYKFVKKISFINIKDRDEVIFIIVSETKGYGTALEREIDISEEFWFTELYPLLQNKM